MKKIEVNRGLKKKEIQEQHSFKVDGTFESYYAATRWLRKNGYSYGSTCVFSPVAIQRGEQYCFAQKWRNLSEEDKRQIDGVITSNDFREGEVTVTIFKDDNKIKP